MEVRNRIARKLGVTILLSTAVVVMAVLFLSLLYTIGNMDKEINSSVDAALVGTNSTIEKILTEVKVATDMLAVGVQLYDGPPDSLFELTRRFVEVHSTINGVVIAYKENYFPGKGRWFAPFSYRYDADSIATIQVGSADMDYFNMPAYQMPVTQGKSVWIDPYYGTDSRRVATYSVPIRNKKGEIIGIVGSDIEVNWLSDMLDSVRIYNPSHMMIASSDATIIAADEKNYINESFYAIAEAIPDSADLVKAGSDALSGGSGMVRFMYGRKVMRLYYDTLSETNWVSCMTCSESDLYSDMVDYFKYLILSALLALILLSLMLSLITNHYMKPLHELAHASQSIAEGNFHTPLPKINTKDEVRMMCDSFESMQASLTSYVEEIEQVSAGRERVQSELRIAHDIQMGMVRKTFPPFPDRQDIDIYATLIPAKEVGGDLYDFFLRGDKLFFIIGDVSGKGVPASLVMAVARAMFRILAESESHPERILQQMNDAVSEANTSNMFVTAFVGILNLKTGEMEFSNAGHNAPAIVGPGQGEAGYLEIIPNLPIGTLSGFKYQKQSIRLNKGTTVFLYTDGITEAENNAHELFGTDRLIDLLKNNSTSGTCEMVNSTLNAVHEHVMDAEQSDDLTILVIKYL